ncbi:LuxR C-terminal-related transcriptional regulator [Quadrisphaera sp. INWT6]|uniref:helix-turn-helix transcriptional regulator n=1 Tax=Quadrisphaera sp. INWT6 TaxID=2596917 RepID=UPI0018926EAC|nr:LuxR C-terminal-related transcriptional regulator [Quadrisphaera sp. INWT6]MBF5080297.1 response regulator transcription factor [Quadrisphaera sp. INWT6]
MSTVLVEHEVDGSGGDGRPRGTTDLLQRTDTADARGAARPGPALGLVGGHPLGAVGLSAAFGGSEVVAVGSGALPPRSVVVADLTCSGCSPATADLAQLARQHRLVLLMGQGQVGLAEEALADGALCSVGAWEPVAELRRAVAAAAAGTPWVSPAAAAAGAQVREVRALLSRQEREVLRLYGADLPVKSVARRMGITVGTAKEYLKRMRAKLAVRGVPVGTKVDLRVLAEQLGLLSPRAQCGSAPAVVDLRAEVG